MLALPSTLHRKSSLRFIVLLLTLAVPNLIPAQTRESRPSTEENNNPTIVKQELISSSIETAPDFGFSNPKTLINNCLADTLSLPELFSKVYNKGLAYIIRGEDQKAKAYFTSLLAKRNVLLHEKQHCAYQLFHYGFYKQFDRYYDGRPSSIYRVHPTNLDHKTLTNATTYLSKCSSLTKIFIYGLEPHLIQDQNEAYSTIIKGSSTNLLKEAIIQTVFTPDRVAEANIYQIWRSSSLKRNDQAVNHVDVKLITAYTEDLLPYLSKMKRGEKTPDDIGLTGDELYQKGMQVYNSLQGPYFKLETHYFCFYLFLRSALLGNHKSFDMLYAVAEKTCKNEHKGNDYFCYRDMLKFAKELDAFSATHDVLSQYAYINKQNIPRLIAMEQESKSTYMAEALKREQERSRIATARREHRQQVWAGILGGLLQTAAVAANTYAGTQTQSSISQGPLTNEQIGNLTPDQLMAYSIQQVNQQLWEEYQAVRAGYLRSGRDLTFDEYMTLCGQAIQYMVDQGEDPLAYYREEGDRRRAEKSAEITARLRGSDEVETAQTTASTRSSSSSTTSASTGATSFSTNSYEEPVEEPDARQQYKREGGSSSDYRYIRRVTLYYRDTDTPRQSMTAKLYKKGAYEYIKIGSKFYLRTAPNWSRFSNAIAYGHGQLYYN